jgi:hypothetical protein
VYCNDSATPLIVAFGIAANGAPWCDLLSNRQFLDDKISDTTTGNVGIDSGDRNESGMSENPTNDTGLSKQEPSPEDLEAIKYLFQTPLRETFKSLTKESRHATFQAPDEIPSNVWRTLGLFKSRSDRVAKHLPNCTITVAARRASRVRKHNRKISDRF